MLALGKLCVRALIHKCQACIDVTVKMTERAIMLDPKTSNHWLSPTSVVHAYNIRAVMVMYLWKHDRQNDINGHFYFKITKIHCSSFASVTEHLINQKKGAKNKNMAICSNWCSAREKGGNYLPGNEGVDEGFRIRGLVGFEEWPHVANERQA